MHDIIVSYLKDIVERCTKALLDGDEEEASDKWMEWEQFLAERGKVPKEAVSKKNATQSKDGTSSCW